MKIVAARALAAVVEEPGAEMILPSPIDQSVAPIVANAVRATAEQAPR